MTTYVNYRGEEIPLIVHPTMPKERKEPPEVYHKGWIVEGYPPEMIEAARERARLAIEKYEALALEEKRKSERPKPFNADEWMNSHKPTRARKPFDAPAAASDCEALVKRLGWRRVTVRALSKGGV